MTSTELLAARPPTAAGPLKLALTPCPLCGRDEAEPVAVGDDSAQGTTRDSFLVVSCSDCGLLYLNPRPVPEERGRLYPPAYFQPRTGHRPGDRSARAAVRRVVRGLPSGACRVLEVGYGAQLHLDLVRRAAPADCALEAVTPHEPLVHAGRAAGFAVHAGLAAAVRGRPAYDLILLLHSLEHCAAPLEEVSVVRGLLRPGGRLVVLTPNAESAVCRRFRGRHWAGYDFPRHPCLFGPQALRRLAAVVGLEIERLDSLGDPWMWAGSAENFLNDWRAPRWLTRAAPAGAFMVGELVALAERARTRNESGPQLYAALRSPAGAKA